MSTKKIEIEKDIELEVSNTFNLFIKPSHIKNWWSANNVICIPKKNGTLAISWGEDSDNPDYVTSFVIKLFNPPNKLYLEEIRHFDALNDKVVFETTLEIEISKNKNGSKIKLVQDGFKANTMEEIEMYEACKKGWYDVLSEIEKYALTL